MQIQCSALQGFTDAELFNATLCFCIAWCWHASPVLGQTLLHSLRTAIALP